MKKKICVYTCITGNYDNINELVFKETGIDYYLFTNNKKITSNTWNVVYIDNVDNLDNVRLARKIKILGHDLLKKYDLTVWIDGNIYFKKKLNDFLSFCPNISEYSFVGFKHSSRNCIYDECKACVKYKKEDKDIILNQIEFLKKENYPENNGLIESTIIFRNMNDKNVIKTCKIWFDMIMRFSCRDQLSFNYSAYKTKLNFLLLDIDVFNNDYFGFLNHNILKEINKYRLYFGDDNNLSKFCYENDAQGHYLKSDNFYFIDEICSCDTDSIKLEICKSGFLYLKNIWINDILVNDNIFLFNGFKFDGKILFFGYDPTVIINHRIKKNDKINIKLDLKFLDDKEIYDIVNLLNHKNNVLNEELCHKNCELETIKNKYNRIISGNFYKIYLKFIKIRRFLH